MYLCQTEPITKCCKSCKCQTAKYVLTKVNTQFKFGTMQYYIESII